MQNDRTTNFRMMCKDLRDSATETQPVSRSNNTPMCAVNSLFIDVINVFIEDSTTTSHEEDKDHDSDPSTDTEDTQGHGDAESEIRSVLGQLLCLRNALQSEASNVGTKQPHLDYESHTRSRTCCSGPPGRKTLDYHLVSARLRHAPVRRESTAAKLQSAI
jgi:hypothetical protein